MDVQKLYMILHQLRTERKRVLAFLDGIEAEVASLIPPETRPKNSKQIRSEISAVLKRRSMRSIK